MYRGFVLDLHELYRNEQPAFVLGKCLAVPWVSGITKTASVKYDKGKMLALIMKCIPGVKTRYFPQIYSNIFISHSHQDEAVAIKLKDWLKESFGLTAFVDETEWGYFNDMSKNLEIGIRPVPSAAISKLLLADSLKSKIIDTECFIFLDTPNSRIYPNLRVTKSTWIFNETRWSYIFPPKSLDNYRIKNASLIQQSFPLLLSHLGSITIDDLRKWKHSCNILRRLSRHTLDLSRHPLDILYFQQDYQKRNNHNEQR